MDGVMFVEDDKLKQIQDACEDGLKAPEATVSQLAAARYYVHRLRVHQYTLDVLRGAKSLEEAQAHYDEAMRNYDGVIALAGGPSDEANAAAMAKGSAEISEMIEKFRHGG